jgi:Uma2 family endonuclease
MAASEQRAALYSVAEYLAFEARAHERHEYHAGYVYAMAGGTAAHSAIGAQVIADLVRHLAGGTCRIHTSDMLIEQGPEDFSYADAAVSCDPRV